MKLKIPQRKTQLDLDFFEIHAIDVARDILGRTLVRERTNKPTLYLRIEEVAAYEGQLKSTSKGILESPGTLGISQKYGKNLIDISTLAICEPSCITLIGGTLYDRRGIREHIHGPGNLSRALEIDKTYDGVPLTFAKMWIGGEKTEKHQIKKRNLSNTTENCQGYFYFRE